MEIKREKMHPDLWLKDIPEPSEQIGFQPDEMSECEKCGRKSPPTRTTCFYCGNELPVSEFAATYFKPNLRKLEEWEKGFNVILIPSAEKITASETSEAAALLQAETEDLHRLFETGKPLPVIRSESKAEAELICEKLAEKNIRAFVLSDEEMSLDELPKRLRGIEFFDDRAVFILFNKDEVAEVDCKDLAVIVKGEISERKIESAENLKRKESDKKIETGETGSDDILLDIYPKGDKTGFRISLSGFDFSCLGAEKELLAKDNIGKLIKKLAACAPQARFDDDYKNSRPSLGKVWEVGERNDAGGLNRKPLAGYKRLKTIIVCNLSQFNRYSRLQSIVYEKSEV